DVQHQEWIEEDGTRLSPADVVHADGPKIPQLEYHFRGGPAVASLAKLSASQHDIKELEHEAYNIFLGNTLKQEASMRNFKAYVITDKSVYFSGEPVKGRVVLGRFDNQTVPSQVVVNGSQINLSNPNAF